ncbi:MAG: hypothetical protein JNL32_01555 [Candidatus Kapabacteria bacterium]|nr:hypothetical protein [Candidatus Kapabacteria bacterium]
MTPIHRAVTAWMLLFVAAFVVTFLVTEPYPTLTMPGFAKVFHAGDNRITYEEPELTLLWSNGSASKVEYHALFGELKTVGATAVMKNIFSSNQRARTSVDTSATSLYQRMKRLRLQMQETLLYDRITANRASAPQTIEWLNRRMAYLYPDSMANGAVPLTLSIRWRARNYNLRDTTMIFISERTTDSLSVSLRTKEGAGR